MLRRQHPTLQVAVDDVASQGSELSDGLLGKLNNDGAQGGLLGVVQTGLIERVENVLQVVNDSLCIRRPIVGDAAAQRIGWGGAAEANISGAGWQWREADGVLPDARWVAKADEGGYAITSIADPVETFASAQAPLATQHWLAHLQVKIEINVSTVPPSRNDDFGVWASVGVRLDSHTHRVCATLTSAFNDVSR